MTKFSAAEITSAFATLESNFAERLSFEEKKGNDKIASNFEKKCMKRINQGTVTFFLTNAIDLNFMNRSNNVVSRLNVYACEKVFRLASATTLDEYTRCILLAARKLQEKGDFLTRNDATHVISANNDALKGERAAFLADVRSKALKGASTVSTQRSSSLQALMSAHFITKATNDNGDEVYALDMKNAHVKKLFATLDKRNAE